MDPSGSRHRVHASEVQAFCGDCGEERAFVPALDARHYGDAPEDPVGEMVPFAHRLESHGRWLCEECGTERRDLAPEVETEHAFRRPR